MTFRNEKNDFRTLQDTTFDRHFMNFRDQDLEENFNIWSEEPLLLHDGNKVTKNDSDLELSIAPMNTIDYYPFIHKIESQSNKNMSILNMGPIKDIDHPLNIQEHDPESSSIKSSNDHSNRFSWIFNWTSKNTNTSSYTQSTSSIRSSRNEITNYIPYTNKSHKKTLMLLLVQLLITFLLFSIPLGESILYPFHVIGVLFHELGHAFMAWITGAKVLSIKIGPNIDGLTTFIGGSFCLICSAGYLGSATAGGLLLFCSFSQKASFVTTWLLICCFVVAVLYSVDAFSFIVPLMMIIFMIFMLRIGDKQRYRYLRWVISMIGVTASTFSIWDIIRDLVLENEHRSDAYQFATYCLYSPAIFVGMAWCIIAVLIITLSILLGIKMFPRASYHG